MTQTTAGEFYLICPEKYHYELSTLIREYLPLVNVTAERREGVEGILLSEDLQQAVLLDGAGKVLFESHARTSRDGCFTGYVGENRKNHAKVAMARVLEKHTGREIPWGILTGVRPSKVAYQYQLEGRTEEETVRILRDHYLLREDKARLCSRVAASERSLMADQRGEDISLYLGVLFCPTRCSYCSFISNDRRAYDRYAASYVDCLIREMEETAPALQGRRINSFYMGGGTPTTLDAGSLERILTTADRLFDLKSMKEVTVEAGRPDTITPEKLEVLKACGVDRISINPQTMNQRTLDAIGRAHSVEAVTEAFYMAREAGFDNINMDLIV
ncbi:MAG: radical SAM protein, partial [Lachnospiraceae bacterium]|nr:radical SAM protein [Lachnospiraceae bacterium]